MSTTTSFHAIMRAIAAGDLDGARELGSRLNTVEHGQLATYGTAVMSICLGHRFDNDSSHDAIRQFVSEMRTNFADADPPLKFFAIEGLIRVFAGEDHILDEISPEDQLEAQFPIIRKIVAESTELQDRFDELLRDADLLARELSNDDS